MLLVMIIKSNSALHLTRKHNYELFHTLCTEQRQENSHKWEETAQKKGRKYNSKLWISLTSFHYQPSQWSMPQRKGQHHIIEIWWFGFFFKGCTCIFSVDSFLYLVIFAIINSVTVFYMQGLDEVFFLYHIHLYRSF